MQLELFGAYVSVMGGVFAAAGITGFLENRERYLGEKSIDDESEKNFVTEMKRRYKDQEIELRFLVDDLLANPADTTLSDLMGGIDVVKLATRGSRHSTPARLPHPQLHVGVHLQHRRRDLQLIIVGDRRPVKYRLIHIERVQAAV